MKECDQNIDKHDQMSLNDASKLPLGLNISKLQNHVNKFQPKGQDVTATYYLLLIQQIDFVFKVIFCKAFGPFVMLLQGLFTVPILAVSSYLFWRFKYAYSATNMKNIVKISALMLVENGLNMILRFFVGLKVFLSQDESKILAVYNLVLPIIFATIWTYINNDASTKNGYYGAPNSLTRRKKFDETESDINGGTIDVESQQSLDIDKSDGKSLQDHRECEQEMNLEIDNESIPIQAFIEDKIKTETDGNYISDLELDISDDDQIEQLDFESLGEMQPLIKQDRIKITNIPSLQMKDMQVRNSCPPEERESLIVQMPNNYQFEKKRENDQISTFSLKSTNSSNLSFRIMGKN